MYWCSLLSTFAFFSFVFRSDSANLTCNFGYISDTENLISRPCDETHPHTIQTYHNTSVTYNYSFHNPEGADVEFHAVNFCIVWLQSKSESINFMCDYHHVCENVSKGFHPGYFYNGDRGTLYCCTGLNCNDASMATKIKEVEKSCYQTNSSSKTQEISQCPSAFCMNQTLYSKNNSVIYNCDQNNFCEDKAGTCVNKTSTDGDKYQVCCCTGSGCNGPDWPSGESMPNPEHEAQEKRSRALTHGVIATGVMLVVLILIVVAVVIRRYQERRRSQLSVNYRQLTADLAEPDARLLDADEGEDDRMIEG